MKLPSLSLLFFSTTVTTLLSPTLTDAFAFGSSSSSSSSSSRIAATGTTNEEIPKQEAPPSLNIAAVTAGTFFAGMSLAAQVAFATPDTITPTTTEISTTMATTSTISTSASTLILSDSENIFALPSYSEAKKNKGIEIELETVNRASMEKSRQARFEPNVDVEGKKRSGAVRKDEIKEEDRMEKMMRLADEERKEKLAKDKEESKASRWSTF